MMSVLFFNISRGFGYGNAIPLSQATCGICDTATTAAVSHLRASDISDRSFSVVTEPTEL